MPIVTLAQETPCALPYVGRGANQQCIYWDEALASFGLRVYPSGRRAYVCAYRIQGRKCLTVLGRAEVLTLEEARQRATAYL